MEVVKQVSYNKTTQKGLYLVLLKYGLKPDKSNHQLVLSIYEVTDKNLGKKHVIAKDDITDVIGIEVYEQANLPDNIEKNIINVIDGYISSVENKEHNISVIGDMLDNLKEMEVEKNNNFNVNSEN